ncbi:MAG: FecR domain-containing protein [Lewinellaceae bacterium]|nr:FecR domain-containing protein [Lewinellaceae bacterium]
MLHSNAGFVRWIKGDTPGGYLNTEKYHRRRLWALAALGSVAASALLIRAILFPVPCPPAISATAIGEQKTVELPDGSTVRLNAVSAIEFVSEKWPRERRVRLIGEAFFQIKKNPAPFIVETFAGTVFVLGTSFDVRYRGAALEVACYSGFVQAASSNGEKQALRTGQKSVARKGRWQQPVSAVTDPWPVWMQGESHFEDAPMYEVFAELARQYDIVVSASGTGGHRFSGRFVHGDLERALRMVCEPLGSQFELEGRTVLIRRKQ